MATTTFPAADGTRLVGEVQDPEGPALGVAVVCHPHPLMGGSMDTWMPPMLQRALVAAGYRTMRFNFRGVGGSEGSFGGGEGELDDVRGAVAHLRDGAPDAAVVLGGWSFGAAVSLRAAGDVPNVAGWFGVGLFVDDEDEVVGEVTRWDHPALFIHGSADRTCPLERTRPIADAAGAARLVVIDGGDHFLGNHANQIGAALRGWLADLR